MLDVERGCYYGLTDYTACMLHVSHNINSNKYRFCRCKTGSILYTLMCAK